MATPSCWDWGLSVFIYISLKSPGKEALADFEQPHRGARPR
jgi:hypothetical protein